jgi:malate synthase
MATRVSAAAKDRGDRSDWIMAANGVRIHPAAWTPQARQLLAPDALELVARAQRELGDERRRLLEARTGRQRAWDAGALPGFVPDGEHPDARGEWRIRELPRDLLRRRVEITGPISDPKMVINMLSRGEDGHRADAAMLDFEDAMKPSWSNVLQGLENLIGAADGTLSFTRPAADGAPEKVYRLDPSDMPLVMVRVRGLHLEETNVLVDGAPAAGGLFDLALSVHHSARTLLDRGRTPKYYVPKCEHYLEARWWNRLFTLLEDALGLETGALRATFLIETLPAAFQVEEILYELRDHVAGLNVGRWDKIFSDIKVLRLHADRVLADRGTITMEQPWMRAYALHLIHTCHRRGAFAMGGMAAFTPGQTPARREEQTRKVVADKRWEASLGHDGCWVSHPYFIAHALEPFERDNQLDVIPDTPARPELLPRGGGPYTLDGLRKNVRVGTAYLKGWNQDVGAVAWDDLMEDLATLEISRAQTWQWLRHRVQLDDGTAVTPERVRSVFAEELARIEEELRATAGGHADAALQAEIDAFRAAAHDAETIFTEREFRPFLACRSDRAGTPTEECRARLRHGTCMTADSGLQQEVS